MLEALVYIYGLIYGFIPVFCKFSFKSLLNVEIAVSQIYFSQKKLESFTVVYLYLVCAVAPEPESGRSVRRADGRDTEAYMYGRTRTQNKF